MKQPPYYDDIRRQMLVDHYTQSGMGVPIFEGYRGQRGHGIGSFLSSFFRSAVPILRKGLSFFGREALRTGSKIAMDVADGRDWKDSAKQRISERISEVVPNLDAQSGSGYRRRRTSKRKRSNNRRSVKRRRGSTKRRRIDIFD